jgi:hypothetical protein
MSRRALSVAAAVALVAMAVPAAANAVLATLANPPDPGAVESCPGSATTPCTVVSRTTAEQVEVGSSKDPFKVTAHGRIVGWTITLSSPTSAQIRYFDAHEGGSAEAAIAVIRQVKGLTYLLESESPLVHLQPYFGRSVTFPLTTSIPVAPGDVIALSVPTWTPALDLDAGDKTAWRASRATTACDDVTAETAQLTIDGTAPYDCIYRTALVDFAAIEITTPAPVTTRG